jgi:hypothetical protein
LTDPTFTKIESPVSGTTENITRNTINANNCFRNYRSIHGLQLTISNTRIIHCR